MEEINYHYTQQPTISFGEAVSSFYVQYFDFKSRSRRSEYWWAMLYEVIFLLFVFSISMLLPDIDILLFIVSIIAILIPDLAVTVRRLHDVGKTGWLVLLCLIPKSIIFLDLTGLTGFLVLCLIQVIGSIIVIGFCLKDSSKRENEWGVSPKYLQSETIDDDDSDNDLSAWSYIWPLLLGLAIAIFSYFAGLYALITLITSFFSLGNDFDYNNISYPDIYESDSSWMIDESETSAIVTDSTDFEVLSDTTEDITSK